MKIRKYRGHILVISIALLEILCMSLYSHFANQYIPWFISSGIIGLLLPIWSVLEVFRYYNRFRTVSKASSHVLCVAAMVSFSISAVIPFVTTVYYSCFEMMEFVFLPFFSNAVTRVFLPVMVVIYFWDFFATKFMPWLEKL